MAEHRLEFPVAYGASVDTVADALGVYYEPHPARTHAAPPFGGLPARSGWEVLLAVYSSGAIGRLVWQDVLGLVKYLGRTVDVRTRLMATNFVGWISTLAGTHARVARRHGGARGLDARRGD